ncbi:Tropomodulin-3 [Oopsacas minuta]|uniref:Tropomodulin-3 n=1 Tax=Oopsacas minuta TaxID=111878 RepID=A0AAV7K0E5_9METZ|nr:Tropomodulin-3 [Oopsacas minuta]
MANCTDGQELDTFLGDLTEDQINELLEELDPDDDLLPASERGRYNIERKPTGKYNPEHLNDHLKEQALRELQIPPDENEVPYRHEIRGKPFSPPVQPASKDSEDEIFDLIKRLDPSEVEDIAELLGMDAGEVNGKQSINEKSSIRRANPVCGLKTLSTEKCREFLETNLDQTQFSFTLAATKIFGSIPSYLHEYQCGEKPVLDWLLDEALKAVKKNTREITSIDLSCVILSHEYIKELAEALSTNNQLKVLKMSNVKMADNSLKCIAEALAYNVRLQVLELETNCFTPDGIMALLKSLEANQKLREIRLSNQKHALGVRVEMEIESALKANTNILKFGYSFTSPGPRNNVERILMTNNELDRQKRKGKNILK